MAVTLLVCGLAVGAAGAAQPATVDGQAGHAIEIRVTAATVNAEGQPTGGAPRTHYVRLARAYIAKGWVTRVSITEPVPALAASAAASPFLGGRMEIGDDGTVAIFDANGNELPVPKRFLPTTVLPGLSDVGGWLRDESPLEPSRRERFARWETTYGRQRGTVRGLRRYLKEEGEETTEVLVDPATGALVEQNVARGSALASRITVEYTKLPGGGLRRRSTRTETVVDAGGSRSTVTAEFIRLTDEVR
jgi:hypothetical protein